MLSRLKSVVNCSNLKVFTCGSAELNKINFIRNNLSVVDSKSLRYYPRSGQESKKLDLSFENAEEAFRSKSNLELVRAYFVYLLCSNDFIVRNNIKIMKVARTTLGNKLFDLCMKLTVYGHFVGGEDQEKIKPTLKKMYSYGVHPILDYSVEEDISEEEAVKREFLGTVSEMERKTPKHFGMDKTEPKEENTDIPQFHNKEFGDRRKKISSARTYFYLNEEVCDRNLETFQQCIEHVGSGKYGPGVAAIKLTALGRPQLLLQISEVIMKARKFVAKVTGLGDDRTNVLHLHLTEGQLEKRLEKHGIKDAKLFLKNVVKDKEGVIHLFPWFGIIDENLNLNETFRIPSLKDGRMVRLITQLSSQEEQMFRNMVRRCNELVKVARQYNVPVMVDAEQTYFQPAISRITMEMMHKHNTKNLLVMNTYQCYLQNSLIEVQNDLEQARRENFYFGAKLVRGAYMEQERSRAASLGYPDPLCPTFEATTEMYNKTVDEVFRHIKINHETDQPIDKIRIMIASHNEETVRYVIKKMRQHNIPPADGSVFFGQLLGMCDYITFPLGQAGYLTYKYVPYGPVREVLPYLSRRVVENTGVLKKVKKEKKLLLEELSRRFKQGQIIYNPSAVNV